MEIQRLLGSDIQMVLDECPAFGASEAAIEKSLALSLRLGARARRRHSASRQGAPVSASCRAACSRICASARRRNSSTIGFDGYAIGGLAVGEGQEAMFDTLDATVPHLPAGSPALSDGRRQAGRYRRRGAARHRHVRLRAADAFGPQRPGVHTQRSRSTCATRGTPADSAPLDSACGCPACRGFSRAYLHHVVKAGEIIAAMLLTWHNLTFYQDLMRDLRSAIAAGGVQAYAHDLPRRLPHRWGRRPRGRRERLTGPPPEPNCPMNSSP